jgi:hypothetical protein
VAQCYYPELKREIDEATHAGEMDRLGSTGCNTLYFKKHISSLHRNHDKTKTITAQLVQKTLDDEFHFAFVKWGFYIQTKA